MLSEESDFAVTRRLQCHTVQLNQQLYDELEQQLHVRCKSRCLYNGYVYNSRRSVEKTEVNEVV